MEDPKTLKEWVLYVSQIPEEDLIVQARFAGTQPFIDMLTEDGFTMDEITTVHKAFALRFRDEGFRIPMFDNTIVDYRAILNPTLPEDGE
jgi:hypothetical protein